jgi:hypothetical protein
MKPPKDQAESTTNTSRRTDDDGRKLGEAVGRPRRRSVERPSLYQLLSQSPLRDVEFDFDGERSAVRDAEF